MGKVTISFVMESCDFQKRRLERLETEARRADSAAVARPTDRATVQPRREPVRENGSHRPRIEPAVSNGPSRAKAPDGKPPPPPPTAQENLEDGEVVEESDGPSSEIEPKRMPEPSTHHRPSSRSPSSFSSKRKRSPTSEHPRNRPPEPPARKDPSRKSQRTPVKSFPSFRDDRSSSRSDSRDRRPRSNTRR